eukprot:148697-Prymnesium_polylepis.1
MWAFPTALPSRPRSRCGPSPKALPMWAFPNRAPNRAPMGRCRWVAAGGGRCCSRPRSSISRCRSCCSATWRTKRCPLTRCQIRIERAILGSTVPY